MSVRLALALSAVVLAASVVHAQSPSASATAQAPAATITRAEAAKALDGLGQALTTYVFQDRVPAARALLRKNRAQYLAISDKEALAARLTADVGAALDDKHFYVRAAAGPAPAPRGAVPSTAPDPREAAEARVAYGIAAVERLPGNIGYLDLRQFASTDAAAARLEAAMDLLADTDALIIDLRANRGGGAVAQDALIGRLSSKPVPRSVIFWRGEDGAVERMEPETRAYPAGKVYARPVFILTANFSVSAAEVFAYDLQAAGRAVVVGETSRGGANPMNHPPIDIGAGLRAWVSNGRSENPITGGSPNGVGVKPDLPTAPEKALEAAYAKALESAGAGDPSAPAGRELAESKADPAAALRKRAPFPG